MKDVRKLKTTQMFVLKSYKSRCTLNIIIGEKQSVVESAYDTSLGNIGLYHLGYLALRLRPPIICVGLRLPMCREMQARIMRGTRCISMCSFLWWSLCSSSLSRVSSFITWYLFTLIKTLSHHWTFLHFALTPASSPKPYTLSNSNLPSPHSA